MTTQTTKKTTTKRKAPVKRVKLPPNPFLHEILELASDQRTKALAKMISSNEIVTLINALGLDPKAYEIDLKEGVDLGIFLGIKNEKNLFKIKNYIDPKKKNIIVDIGANIGSVSLPLAKLFNSSTIISVEPTYYAFSKLKRNLNLNPNFKKRVRLYNVKSLLEQY